MTEQINQILSELKCLSYTFNEAKGIIENSHSGSSIHQIIELTDIIQELNTQNVKYDVDEVENIILKTI